MQATTKVQLRKWEHYKHSAVTDCFILKITYPIRIILHVDIVTRYQPSQKKFRTIVRGSSLLTFPEPGHTKQRTRQKAECLFIMN